MPCKLEHVVKNTGQHMLPLSSNGFAQGYNITRNFNTFNIFST